MPANTVKVDRATRYGNPYFVVQNGDLWHVAKWMKRGEVRIPIRCSSDFPQKTDATKAAVEMFRVKRIPEIRSLIAGLRGKNLACWCKSDEPCHADVLLDEANA